jgi:hypothetical protein
MTWFEWLLKQSNYRKISDCLVLAERLAEVAAKAGNKIDFFLRIPEDSLNLY